MTSSASWDTSTVWNLIAISYSVVQSLLFRFNLMCLSEIHPDFHINANQMEFIKIVCIKYCYLYFTTQKYIRWMKNLFATCIVQKCADTLIRLSINESSSLVLHCLLLLDWNFSITLCFWSLKIKKGLPKASCCTVVDRTI